MTIDPASREQFRDWRRLPQAVYSGLDEEFHASEVEWIIASPDCAGFRVIADDRQAVALLEISLRYIVEGCIGGPVGYIERFCVDARVRGQGLGRRLVDYAAAWFRQQGCRDMATDAELDNIEAQAFYARLEFAATWQTVGFHRSLG